MNEIWDDFKKGLRESPHVFFAPLGVVFRLISNLLLGRFGPKPPMRNAGS